MLSEAKQKGVIKILREVTTPSGIDKTFEVSVRYIVLNDQGIAVLFARDVGEREALLARASASERFKAVAEMAGAIAHDLNNKLMVTAGHLEILKDGLRLPDPSIDKGLPSIEKPNRLWPLLPNLSTSSSSSLAARCCSGKNRFAANTGRS